MHYTLLFLFFMMYAVDVLAQAPLRLSTNEVDAYYTAQAHREERSIDLRLGECAGRGTEKKRKGKALIYSGLGTMALGMLGVVYASGPDLKGRYLIDSPELFLIAPFTPLDAMVGIASMAVVLGGSGLTAWGTVKYIKSK